MESRVFSTRIPIDLEKKLKDIMEKNKIRDFSKAFQMLISNYNNEGLKRIKVQKVDSGIELSKYCYKVYNLSTKKIEKEGFFKDIKFDKKEFINNLFNSLKVSNQYCFLNKNILYKEIVSKIFNTKEIKENKKRDMRGVGSPDFELSDCYVEFKFGNDRLDRKQMEFSINSEKDYKILWIFKD